MMVLRIEPVPFERKRELVILPDTVQRKSPYAWAGHLPVARVACADGW
jgi:hypothetical protein